MKHFDEGPDANHLLNEGLNTIHSESKAWLNAIEHWKTEITSMLMLSKSVNASAPVIAEIQKIAKALARLDTMLDKLYNDIDQHKHYLFKLLKGEKQDVEGYREKHRELLLHFTAERDHFLALRHEMYKMDEAAHTHFLVINQTIQTINSRRAVRKYFAKKPESRLVDALINAGRVAPSAMNLQPWKFYVVSDRKKIRQFSAAISAVAKPFFNLVRGTNHNDVTDPIFHNAPLVIFLVGPKESIWAGLDLGMCAQNIMLAAKSLGLETCPVGYGTLLKHTPHYASLGIDEGDTIYLAITVGYGNETPIEHKHNTDNVFYV